MNASRLSIHHHCCAIVLTSSAVACAVDLWAFSSCAVV